MRIRHNPFRRRRPARLFSGRLHKAGASAALAGAFLAALPTMPASAGTWTIVNPDLNGGGSGNVWLQTDGTIIAKLGSSGYNTWERLTPDSSGSYANGTWTRLADSAYGRLYGQEHVLNDGRFYEQGGEYILSGVTNGTNEDYNTVEIYDPVTNVWTREPNGLYGDIGDTASCLLPDGEVFSSSRLSKATQIFNPATNTWRAAASKTDNTGDEEEWTPLFNGNIWALSNTSHDLYDVQADKWIVDSSPAAAFSPGYPGDIGACCSLYDGRILCLGYLTTAIYTPSPNKNTPGTYAPGPALPGANSPDGEDDNGLVEPNGRFLFDTTPVNQPSGGDGGNVYNEWDPATNKITAIPGPPDGLNNVPFEECVLPNGQILVAVSGGRNYVYTPDGGPQDSWRPTVTSVSLVSGTTYTLTGTQLAGLVKGTEGQDDLTGEENFPIVYLTNGAGRVWYCKSTNFSTRFPIPGSTPQTCNFTLPAGLANGTYNLYVSAVGVSSKNAYSFTVGSSAPNFTLSASPSSLTVNRSASKTSTITVTPSGGFTGSVSLTASGLPSGVTASFSPSTTSSTSTLTLTASSTAATGTSTITVTAATVAGGAGAPGGLIQTATISLTVTSTTTPAPAAFWAFDESSGTSAADSSGNGHTATVTGGAFTTGSKVGSHALSLSGSSQYAEASGAVVDTSASFTAAAWVKLNSVSGYQTILSIDGTNTSAFYLQLNAGNGGKFVFNRLASDSDSAASTVAVASSAPSTGTWYHVVGVYDASAKTIALYINGSLQQSVSYTSGWKGTGKTAIGRGLFSAAKKDFVNGVIDNARIYNSALTAAQVSALYSGGG
jgi:hypothetical protein